MEEVQREDGGKARDPGGQTAEHERGQLGGVREAQEAGIDGQGEGLPGGSSEDKRQIGCSEHESSPGGKGTPREHQDSTRGGEHKKRKEGEKETARDEEDAAQEGSSGQQDAQQPGTSRGHEGVARVGHPTQARPQRSVAPREDGYGLHAPTE